MSRRSHRKRFGCFKSTPSKSKRLVEEASALYRRRAKSTARTASYGKNLASLREALAAMKDECQTHVNLEGDAKASWIATLDRAIRWIEQPDSEF